MPDIAQVFATTGLTSDCFRLFTLQVGVLFRLKKLIQHLIGLRHCDLSSRALRAVVDVEEFKGLEDGVFFAGRTAAGFAVSRHRRAWDYAERIAAGFFEDF